MFNLQGSELVIILLLALVVLGPEKLPDAMRKAGQFYAELKKMSSGFQSEFRAVIDEPIKELKDTANTIRDSADFTSLQAGERTEKPKSGEMAAADATPSTDLPLGQAAAGAAAVGADTAAAAAADDPAADDPAADDPAADDPAADGRPADPEHVETAAPPIPAPPNPFSSSQALSVTPPARPDGDHVDDVETPDSGSSSDTAPPEPFSSSQQLSSSPAALPHRPAGSEAERPRVSGTPGEPVVEAVESADGARSDEPSEEHTE